MFVSRLSVMELPDLQQAQVQNASMQACWALTVCAIEQSKLQRLCSSIGKLQWLAAAVITEALR